MRMPVTKPVTGIRISHKTQSGISGIEKVNRRASFRKKCIFQGVKITEKCMELYRKISQEIENHLKSGNDKILVIDGARQIGKRR